MADDSDHDDLLTRLNALKAPTKAPRAVEPAIPHPSIRPANADDDIVSRFRRLASGSGPSPERPQGPAPSAQSRIDDVVADLPSERVHNDEDDQSLDDLLKELGADQSSWMNVPEEDRISDLLKEAKAALPQETPENQGPEHSQERPEVDLRQDQLGEESAEQARSQDEQDEKDADDYIAQVMADIELQKKQGTFKEDDSSSEAGQVEEQKATGQDKVQTPARPVREASPLDDLPSAPLTAPVIASIEDGELEARFASLSLPSTPSNRPTSKKPAAGAKAKSNLPTYTDEDIESWCVICNEDATVRCLGCEGDLYCQECWNEGHRSPDAGYEERTHKAVVYTRGEGKRKSLAAA
jgi:hypothetical protein